MPILLLFDIDGTLVLTGGAGGRAMTRAFRDVYGVDSAFHGIPMPGRTDPLIVADALRHAGHPPADGNLARFRARYLECLRDEIELPGPRKGALPGVEALLDVLGRERPDMFLALLTGNFSEAARLKLEYFDLWRHFACGAYGEDAADRNGLVAVAVDRAQACGAPNEALQRVVVIGDTPLDVECARASKALAVGVATGHHSVEELRACGADMTFEDLSDTAAVMGTLDAVERRFAAPCVRSE